MFWPSNQNFNRTKLFHLALLIKALDGAFGIVIGLILLLVSRLTLVKLVNLATIYELAEDRQDLIASWLVHITSSLSISTKLFIALYLVIYGLVKVILVIGLWKYQRWSYHAAIYFILAMIFYQSFREWHTHSIVLALLTMADLFILYFVFIDYEKRVGEGIK